MRYRHEATLTASNQIRQYFCAGSPIRLKPGIRRADGDREDIEPLSHSVDLREPVVSYVSGGGSCTTVSQVSQVGRTTLYRWLNSFDLWPRPAKERRRKLDKAALAGHVPDYPDALLRELAAHF